MCTFVSWSRRRRRKFIARIINRLRIAIFPLFLSVCAENCVCVCFNCYFTVEESPKHSKLTFCMCILMMGRYYWLYMTSVLIVCCEFIIFLYKLNVI